MTDLGQLTKANSIEGNKKDNISVIYTPWSNLKKDGSYAVGQVGFKDPRKVKRVLIAQRENAIVNRLNKTRVEKTQPDLFKEKEDHLRQLRKRDQAAKQERVRCHSFSPPIFFTWFCAVMAVHLPFVVFHLHMSFDVHQGILLMQTNITTEEGRGEDSTGESREEVAEGSRI